MQVILLKSVKGLGDAGQIVEAKPGYVANYLLPQGLASQDLDTKIDTQGGSVDASKLVALAKKLSGVTIKLKRKANEKGKLFSAVNEKDIKDALSKKIPEELLDHISVSKGLPLKEIGEISVILKVADQEAKIRLSVTAS